MKKYYLPPLLTFILLASTMTPGTSQNAQPSSTDPNSNTLGITIYVDDSNTIGPWNGTHDYPYQHISEGILHATDGDTVYVFNGLYNETVTINKSIFFRGQQQDNTVIDGRYNGSVIDVTSNNVTIRRLTIRNSGGYQGNAGITVNSNNTTITECTVYRTRTGISLQNGSETTITNCRFHTNGYGITSLSSAFVTIDQCTFYHNGIGVYLQNTHCTTITNSYADTNGIGFLGFHSTNIQISHSAARDNDDNEGGMFFSHCAYVNLINCNICHNGLGVNLVNSFSVFIDHCKFSLNTHFACKLTESLSGIILTNCLFTQNLRYGIHAEKSMFTVRWSNFEQNQNFGLYATSSSIDAYYNWWGLLTGPAHTGLSIADRGTWDHRSIRYAPWLTFPMPDVGTDWDLNKTYQKPPSIIPWPDQITFSQPDTDHDGAPDWWEEKYRYNPAVPDDHLHLDPDNDSLNNIEECYMDQYGANPFTKDVFLEFDWIKSSNSNVTNKPTSEEIAKMTLAFQQHNITLHVDTGNLGGGEELPPRAFVSYADLVDIYWDYFLHNNVNNPRQRIFHYGLICDYSEGPGFAFVGWDNLNAFVIAAQLLEDNYKLYTRGWLAMTASMHETGHTFGLVASKYIGIDNQATIKPYYKEFWLYRNYKSLMSYMYTWSFMDYSDGSHGRGDFNDWGSLDFSFFKNTQFTWPT